MKVVGQIFILCILVFLTTTTLASNDSLLNVIQDIKDPKAFFNLYEDDLYFNSKTEKIVKEKGALKAAEMSRVLNDTLRLRDAFLDLSAFSENLDYALIYADSSLRLSMLLNDSLSIAKSYNNIGNTYRKKGNFSDALQYHLRALELRERIGDSVLMPSSLLNIGVVYYYFKEYDKTAEHYYRALEMSEKLKNSRLQIIILINLIEIHALENKFDKSTEAASRAKELLAEHPQADQHHRLYLNLGEMNEMKQDLVLAEYNYLKCLELLENSQNTIRIAIVFEHLASLYESQEKYSRAIEYFEKSESIFLKMNYSKNLFNCYNHLENIYLKLKRYQKAHHYGNLKFKINDTLHISSNAKMVAEMKTKYEIQQKEKEIELLSAQNDIKTLALEKAAYLKGLFIAGMLLFVFIAIILLIGFSSKRKRNRLLEQKNTIISRQKEDILASISYAKRIQDSILEEETVIAEYLKDFFIYYEPKDIVSGDFYWFTHIDGKTIVSAVDCTGHGVPGAFMSMIGNSGLNEIVKAQGITKPSEILELLHQRIFSELNQSNNRGSQDGMDMSVITYEHGSGKLEFAGAMNNLIHISGDTIRSVTADRMPVGGRRMINEKTNTRKFKNHELTIDSGDSIYLYTDGIIDQFGGPNRKKFGTRSFKDLILKLSSFNMTEQKAKINKAMLDWKSHHQQLDDMLVIGIRF